MLFDSFGLHFRPNARYKKETLKRCRLYMSASIGIMIP